MVGRGNCGMETVARLEFGRKVILALTFRLRCDMMVVGVGF